MEISTVAGCGCLLKNCFMGKMAIAECGTIANSDLDLALVI